MLHLRVYDAPADLRQRFRAPLQSAHLLLEFLEGFLRLLALGRLRLGIELLADGVAHHLRLLRELLGLGVHVLDVSRRFREALLVVPLEAWLAHVHEKIGEAQEVILLPDIMWMAMALGAFEPKTEESVGDLQRARH